MALQPRRTVQELRELQELTGDENGAQRVAWTETWERAREWLREKVVGTGAEESVDAAGNQWFTLHGNSERAVLLGGHIDSVPNGGWLDGALNMMAGAEVLRQLGFRNAYGIDLNPGPENELVRVGDFNRLEETDGSCCSGEGGVPDRASGKQAASRGGPRWQRAHSGARGDQR